MAQPKIIKAEASKLAIHPLNASQKIKLELLHEGGKHSIELDKAEAIELYAFLAQQLKTL